MLRRKQFTLISGRPSWWLWNWGRVWHSEEGRLESCDMLSSLGPGSSSLNRCLCLLLLAAAFRSGCEELSDANLHTKELALYPCPWETHAVHGAHEQPLTCWQLSIVSPLHMERPPQHVLAVEFSLVSCKNLLLLSLPRVDFVPSLLFLLFEYWVEDWKWGLENERKKSESWVFGDKLHGSFCFTPLGHVSVSVMRQRAQRLCRWIISVLSKNRAGVRLFFMGEQHSISVICTERIG